MSWFLCAEFPLEQNLSGLNKQLTTMGVGHRFTEEQGRLRLWVAQRRDIPSVESLIERGYGDEGSNNGSDGVGNEDIGGGCDSDEGDHHASGIDDYSADIKSAEAKVPSLLEQIAQSPLTSGTIVLGVFGYLIREILAIPILLQFFYFHPPEILAKSYAFWTWLTPTFLHFSLLHLVFNAVLIWYFGLRLESFLGKLNYIFAFLFIAIAANLLQFLASGQILFGGLSGVVYGYLGLLAVLSRYFHYRILFIPQGLYIYMVAMLALGFTGLMDFLMVGSVANWAHLGGLLAGLLAGGFFTRFGEKKH